MREISEKRGVCEEMIDCMCYFERGNIMNKDNAIQCQHSLHTDHVLESIHKSHLRAMLVHANDSCSFLRP